MFNKYTINDVNIFFDIHITQNQQPRGCAGQGLVNVIVGA